MRNASTGCVIPSVVVLEKCLAQLAETVQYHSALMANLADGVKTRFAVLYSLVKLSPKKNNGSAKFGHMVYLMTAALDPNYGFVWLDSDHPGDDNVRFSGTLSQML